MVPPLEGVVLVLGQRSNSRICAAELTKSVWKTRTPGMGVRGMTEMQPTDAELLAALSCPEDLERLAVLAAIAEARPSLAAELIRLWREYDLRMGR